MLQESKLGSVHTKVDNRILLPYLTGVLKKPFDVIITMTEILNHSQRITLDKCGFVSDGDDVGTIFGGTINPRNLSIISDLPFVKKIELN